MDDKNNSLFTVTEVTLQNVDGEPRVRDLDLAARLGFDRPRKIRELIERNITEIEHFGTCPTVGRVARGNPVKEYHLNEEQALLVSVLSNAPNAAAVRAMLIKVFVAYRRGELAPPPPANQNLALVGREARLQFRLGLSLAKMLGLTGNQAAFSANGLALKTTGIDVLGSMGQKRIEAPQQEVLLTATDIGRQLGGMSAVAVNNLLSELHLQIGGRDAKGRPYWEPTDEGISVGGVMLDTERSNGTGTARQLRWASGVVLLLKAIIKDRAA